ncbi:MAG: ferrous iron transport protein B [Clostridiales bacterium]|jgi:ferrous iron transport protein B|nr:ferrous iron transport protein B [Clostridiales bacterium]
MSIKIALAGNPNCGKTTLFNNLTGSSQHVGNWPGVTVEKKEGKLKGHKDVIIQDLPGIYSLSPYTLEEVVSRNYLIHDKPDVILNLLDASNLERNLYLTTQLTEVGVPVILALNMMDIVKKTGDKIDTEKLSQALGCPIAEISAVKNIGAKDAAEQAVNLAQSQASTHPQHSFSDPVENTLGKIVEMIHDIVKPEQERWYAIKLFERDEKVMEEFHFGEDVTKKLEDAIQACETELDDDSESIITNERYSYISNVMKTCVQKKQRGLSISDKIDKIVTNRWLALPIFAAVMFLVYFISVSTIGTMGNDWVNDELFGNIIPPAMESWLSSMNTADWLQSLILEGIIGGVGAVIGFLPQIIVLFFLLALLEDCGYMARIAFIMDRIFRKFGLSGKSFIPILIGTGCGVPGVMASRTIENDADRKMTIMTTTFIPCSAKLPIIALVAGALFRDSWWVAPAAYFIGIAAIICSGIILKKMKPFAGDPAPFVMELPAYHAPRPKGVLIHMWERVRSFIIKAGTIIFVSCGIIWFLQTFNWSMQMVEADESMLASIGNFIAPIFAPLGFGNWQSSVATVTGFVAKENVVGTFGTLFHYTGELSDNGAEIFTNLATIFTPLSAFSFMLFNLLCAPCFAAIGAIKREMDSWRWMWIAVGYQCVLAYAASLVVYQFGLLFTGQGFTVATAIAILVCAAFFFLLFRPNRVRNTNRLSSIKANS